MSYRVIGKDCNRISLITLQTQLIARDYVMEHVKGSPADVRVTEGNIVVYRKLVSGVVTRGGTIDFLARPPREDLTVVAAGSLAQSREFKSGCTLDQFLQTAQAATSGKPAAHDADVDASTARSQFDDSLDIWRHATPKHQPLAESWNKGALIGGPIPIPASQVEPVNTGIYLQDGTKYVVVAKGTCSIWTAPKDCIDPLFIFASPSDPDGRQRKLRGSLTFFDPQTDFSSLAKKQKDYSYRNDHTYEATIIGEGATLKATIPAVGGKSSTSGGFMIEVYIAVPPNVQTPAAAKPE